MQLVPVTSRRERGDCQDAGLSACQGWLGSLDTNGGRLPWVPSGMLLRIYNSKCFGVTVSLLEIGPSERNRFSFSQFGQLVIQCFGNLARGLATKENRVGRKEEDRQNWVPAQSDLRAPLRTGKKTQVRGSR